MNTPGPRVDWLRLTHRPSVRAAARAIAARWRVWVGLVTGAGEIIPLAPATWNQQVPNHDNVPPACAYFKRRLDETGSCSSSLLAWSRSSGLQHCHAGYTAIVAPVPTSDATASVYVSGFLETEHHLRGIAESLNRAEALGFTRSEVVGASDSMTRLSAAERDAVAILAGVIATELVPEPRLSSDARGPAPDYSHIVGESLVLRRLFGVLDKLVQSDATVLIQGENGTGKELFARAVHANSRRRHLSFVTQNCSAINDNLLNSELFGHIRGSFTGAIGDKRGLFELAHGGTLFLDEVGDMTAAMQVKLLRVLQDGTFVAVGDVVTRKVDVRVIAATNRNLYEMAQQGRFREDLYYRLNVISLTVPALRERRDDMMLLSEYFKDEYTLRVDAPEKHFHPNVIELFRGYEWPGNVRELRHEVERLVVLSGGSSVIPATLVSPHIRKLSGFGKGVSITLNAPAKATLPEAITALERQMIHRALKDHSWNKTRAAKALGVSRRNLIRKVAALGLDKRDEPENT